jgi:hypothetical protein
MQTRQEFVLKAGGAAPLVVFPVPIPSTALEQDSRLETFENFSSALKELLGISTSSGARNINRMRADFYTDPSVHALVAKNYYYYFCWPPCGAKPYGIASLRPPREAITFHLFWAAFFSPTDSVLDRWSFYLANTPASPPFL